MHSKLSQEGYLMIDHRASPGLPENFYRNIGLAGPKSPGGKLVEQATLICCGCGGAYIKNPDRLRVRHHCRQCDSYMCDNCALKMKLGDVHIPFKKKLDKAEKLAYREQQNSLVSRFGLIKG